MNIPGFSAEASLHKTSGHYQPDRHTINPSTEMSAAIYSGTVYPSAKGQDFPDLKCTCKGCAAGGGDLSGQCASVCKDKTVYSKGSEPNDYCKASERVLPPWRFTNFSGVTGFAF